MTATFGTPLGDPDRQVGSGAVATRPTFEPLRPAQGLLEVLAMPAAKAPALIALGLWTAAATATLAAEIPTVRVRDGNRTLLGWRADPRVIAIQQITRARGPGRPGRLRLDGTARLEVASLAPCPVAPAGESTSYPRPVPRAAMCTAPVLSRASAITRSS
jgi:hypothetical protein